MARKKIILLLTSLFLIFSCLFYLSGCAPAPPPKLTDTVAMVKTHPWVEKTLRHLSLEEKIGQLFLFPSVAAIFLPIVRK